MFVVFLVVVSCSGGEFPNCWWKRSSRDQGFDLKPSTCGVPAVV